MKVGCIIQGDIRRGSNLVLDFIPKLFDYTVLSTWNEGQQIPRGNFEVLQNHIPKIPGYTNRNYQRFTVARGLEAARSAGCDYVLKWRTDMLPTKISVHQLLDWAQFSSPAGVKSRIVIPAFRNLSVQPDVFSTIPDLFSFGHIDEMSKLWGDEGFNYTLDWNMSLADQKTLGPELLSSQSLADYYCAEAELYAIYRSRLAAELGSELTHKMVAENYLRLIDHNKLGILWFGGQSGFRSIGQAWEHPWWTEKIWEKQNAPIHPFGYRTHGLIGRLKRKISKIKIRSEISRQEKIWRDTFPGKII